MFVQEQYILKSIDNLPLLTDVLFIQVNILNRLITDRHQALFIALANHADKAGIKIQIRYLQPDQFRNT
ncbi:hypothetical protein D3C86_1443410 [compost metagenome]